MNNYHILIKISMHSICKASMFAEMKRNRNYTSALGLIFIIWIFIVHLSSCANIVPPTGGPRDSLPPRLVEANPKDSATNVNTQKLVLIFDEFVTLDQIQENLIVSPLPNINPQVDYKLRTVTIKFKDSLLPNTTYSLNFGKGLKDVNEGNIAQNFSYTFSTGNTIDQNTLSGKVILAETGGIDTTLLAVLYTNLTDSAVYKFKPDYITRLNGNGEFTFKYLPNKLFALYVIPNEYNKRYEDSTKPFAFYPTSIAVNNKDTTVLMYAYAYPETPKSSSSTNNNTKDKQLRYALNIQNSVADVFDTLQILFPRKINKVDETKIQLCDSSYRKLPAQFQLNKDSTALQVLYSFQFGQAYHLKIDSASFKDIAGLQNLFKDTLHFTTKTAEDYGSLKMRFLNIDTSLHPIIQFVQNNKVDIQIPLKGNELKIKYFKPGDYQLRILYDSNQNGRWDPGVFIPLKKQPEKVIALSRRLNIKPNWDNEVDITLE